MYPFNWYFLCTYYGLSPEQGISTSKTSKVPLSVWYLLPSTEITKYKQIQKFKADEEKQKVCAQRK